MKVRLLSKICHSVPIESDKSNSNPTLMKTNSTDSDFEIYLGNRIEKTVPLPGVDSTSRAPL